MKLTELLAKNNAKAFIKISTNKQWTLKKTCNTIETFMKAIKNKSQREEQIQTNFLKLIWHKKKEALKDLNLWDDIIITVTKTQKANAVVIIHVEDFINEANL